MPFDPDKYLTEKTGAGSFNPDQYLKEKTASLRAPDEMENLRLMQSDPMDLSVPTADRMAALETQGAGEPSTTKTERDRLKKTELIGLGLMTAAGTLIPSTGVVAGAAPFKNFPASPGSPILSIPGESVLGPALSQAPGLIATAGKAAAPHALKGALHGIGLGAGSSAGYAIAKALGLMGH